MATLTQPRDAAISHLRKKLTLGSELRVSSRNARTRSDFDAVADAHSTWKQATGNTLKQLFNNTEIAENFLHEEPFTVFANAGLEENIDDLTQEISNDISKLQHIIDDLENDLYKFSSNSNPNPEVSKARISLWSAVLVALITTAGGIISGYWAAPPKPATAADKQGLGNLSILGKWSYVCTDYNGKYQHGGRFTVIKLNNGAFQLNGERMWKDVQNDSSSEWVCRKFHGDSILPWKSEWIYVHDENQLNMEYELNDHGHIVKGYCTGDITENNDKVEKVEGHFYQLLPQTPLRAGRVTFTRVTDHEYNDLLWRKNHICGN